MFSSVGTCSSSSVQTATVGIQPPTNLFVTNVGASTITISFTPSTSFFVTNYIATTNTGAQAISTGSPITITGLKSGTTYTTTIIAVNNNGVFSGDSFSVSATTISSNILSLSVVNFQSSDITGTSTTGSSLYNVYVFKNTGISYTINYNFIGTVTIYVLAVGGGGAGGCNGGGGGGAGGVIMLPVSIPTGTGTITISVGAGGLVTSANGNGVSGSNTTVTFSSQTSYNITAGGGASGGNYGSASVNSNNNASGGGGGLASALTNANINPSGSILSSYIYANAGGGQDGNGAQGGGGGAGTSGRAGSSTVSPAGGNGIQCTLDGIKDFSPSGTSYGTYYWGGGGGGSISNTSTVSGGNGGLGGGGGGVQFSASLPGGSAGGSALNSGGAGQNNNGAPGNGGANTGGGGGGSYNNSNSRSAGGSGIVIIAFTGTPSASSINTGIPSPPTVTSIVSTTTTLTINYAQQTNVTTGSTYSLYNGSTIYGTATYPATSISLTNLAPNTQYPFFLTATNAYGTSLPTKIIGLTNPTNFVYQLVSASSSSILLNILNTGSNTSIFNTMSVLPLNIFNPITITNSSTSNFTINNTISNTNYLINNVLSNFSGAVNQIFGQNTNTSTLVTIASGATKPAFNYYGQYICVGCYGNGIYVSTNSGGTFNKIITDSNASQSAMSDTGQYMYVACNNIGRVYYSSNYGTSFTAVSLGSNITSIACSISGINVFVTDSTNGGIYYSTNFGVTWSSIVTIAANVNNIICNIAGSIAYFTSTSTGKAYSYNLSTTTTTQYSPGGVSNVSGIAVSLNGQYIYITTYGGLCYTSNDAGVSFTAVLTTYLPSGNYSGIVCDTTGQYVYIHNSTTTFYCSSDYGATFSSVTLNSASSSISINSNSTFLGITSGSGLYISTNSYFYNSSASNNFPIIDASFNIPSQTTNGFTYYVNSGFIKSTGFNYSSIPGWSINYSNAAVAIANGSNTFFTATMPSGTFQAIVVQVNGTYTTTPYCMLSQVLTFNNTGNYNLTFSTIPKAITDPSYINLNAMINNFSTSTTLANSITSWNSVTMPFTISSPGNYAMNFYYSVPVTYLNTAINSSISLTNINIIPVFNPPTNLRIVSLTTSSVVLSFVDSSCGGIFPTSYTSNFGTGSGTSSAYTITGLTYNTSYPITLVANYPAGYYLTGYSPVVSSSPSVPITVVTSPIKPILTLSSITATTMIFTITNILFAPPTISASSTPGYTYSIGTGLTNGVSYNVYFFTSSTITPLTTTYTLNYNCNSFNYCYVFAVGGGGSGSSYAGAGGGGGGVVMMPVTLPSGSTTITASVGSGGAASGGNALGNRGYNSYVNFSSVSSSNVIAYGGGYGSGGNPTVSASSGGSGGGGDNGAGNGLNGTGNNIGNNFANSGAVFNSSAGQNGGGGGGAGGSPPSAVNYGGPGIICNLPGIKDYIPIGKSNLGSYYWAGGGGGSVNGSYNQNGGIGGGGGGANPSTGTSQLGGTGYNNGGAGATSNGAGGAGGINTGGGGGGAWNGIGGAGGSGIVAIAFPILKESFVVRNYNFASPVVSSNSASTLNTIPTGWSVTGSGSYYILNGTGGATYNLNACPYGQFFYTTTTTTVVLSQIISLYSAIYTISFSAAVLSTFTGSFTITIGSNTYTSRLTNSNIYWNTYTWDFMNSAAGTYNLTFTFNCPVGITQIMVYPAVSQSIENTNNMSFLVVGGGGGGSAGGGGGGGVVYNLGLSIPSGTIFIATVGTGGSGGNPNSGIGSTGNDSSLVYSSNTIIAKGGGGGAANASTGIGNSGGSGGGGTYSVNTPGPAGGSSIQQSYSGCNVYGNSGGNSGNFNASPYPSGGGGGAGSIGGNGTSTTVAGNGGAGVLIPITGSYYGGGGGGSFSVTGGVTAGLGGSGGGAAGTINSTVYSGTANTGGGGGGALQSVTAGGAGGSGVIIISVPTSTFNSSNFSGSGTYITSVSGTNTIITFTSGITSYATGSTLNVPPLLGPTYVTTSLIINLDSTLGVTGSTWTDQTANAFNYTFYNNTNFTTTNITTTTINGFQVISLNGSTNFLWRNSATGFGSNFLTSFTYEMWVYPTITKNATLIFEYGQNGFSGWSDDQLGLNSSGYFTSYVYSGSAIGNGVSTSAYLVNRWYHIANVYDKTANILYQYVNGSLSRQVSVTKSYPTTIWLSLCGNTGGGSYMNGTGYFQGYIGAFRGYNIALSSAQILQNYNGSKTVRYT
uniref:Fibronectin type-III domain-containing protein n=1 Tax=viral metagenome TaxID=1070528 RepID=A0A6C0HS77_9ZZZZ